MHYGIKGQKWGVRRYQNTDGSWTAAGKARYSKSSGKRARYGSENTVDSKTAVKVAKINRKIDKYNTRLQRAKVDNDAIQSMSTGRIAALQGAKSVGVTAGRAAPFIAEAGKAAVPLLGPTLLTTGLTNAALGAGVMGGMKAGSKTRANEKRLEKKIKKLQGQRYALDPSQANRKGSILTKEEYAKQFNANRGGMHGLAAGGLVGGLAGAALGAKSKNTRDAEYENYKKNAVAYGKKKTKYGSDNTTDADKAARVDALNKKIDKLNLRMQKGTARSYGYNDVSVGKQAALRGGVTAGLSGAVAFKNGVDAARFANKWNKMNAAQQAARTATRPWEVNLGRVGATNAVNTVKRISPAATGLKFAVPAMATAGITNAIGGALVGAGAKYVGGGDLLRKGREKKIAKLQAERNALDASQQNRKGRILTKEEFNKQFNGAKGGITGLNLGGLVGGAVGAAVGKRSEKTHDLDYELYKKNAVAYGKKKKRR